jgi:predicted HNH restriction endonuclease
MASKLKNNVPKVKLSVATLAKEAAELAEAKVAKKLAALNIPKGTTSKKYSAQVEAAIKAHDSRPKKKFSKWTPKREVEEDLKLAEASLMAYKTDRTKGENYNGYFINLYAGFVKSLKAEIIKLS